VCFFSRTVFGANVQLLPSLPASAVPNAIQLDGAGNIYVAGSYLTNVPPNLNHAFVAKLSSDGSKQIYFANFGGSFGDVATALIVMPDGTVYVAGNTNSVDFAVTPDAFQSKWAGQTQGFLAKLNPAGDVVYSSYINGIPFTTVTGMAVNRAGEVFLTGGGGPAADTSLPTEGYLLKLDASLSKQLLSVYGYGGGLVTLDVQGNIYLAGIALPKATAGTGSFTLTLPPLPAGAFQSTHDARICLALNAGPGGGGSLVSCRHQYVAKLNAAGTVLWATYVTGTYGAIVRGMAVDAAGNVIVAGSTNSDDYPVTPGVLQPLYAAAAPPYPAPPGNTYRDPPPASGYVTKVNSNGTGLIWSTYFGGSSIDDITGLAVDAKGEIIVSGRATSSDLPGLAGTPAGCRPSPNQKLAFVGRISADGTSAAPAQLIAGAPVCVFSGCSVLSDYGNNITSWPLALRPDGGALVAGPNGAVASVDFAANTRLSCLVDPADNAQLRAVAPGQLLTLFGDDLAPAAPFTPPGAATSTSDLGVFFNGVPAPILYAAGQQINVQVPFEIAGQATVQMQVVDKQIPLALTETRTLPLVERQPAVFLSPDGIESPFPGYSVCHGAVSIGTAAVALNADGTRNACDNPAVEGSVVTIFAEGLGQPTPPAVVGALDSRLAPLTTATQAIPGAAGVVQVQLTVPQPLNPALPFQFTPLVAGKNMRARLVLIWTRPAAPPN
jgi:uncharacterized protein (TIGR03437 family)